jgi:competence protein ComEA
MESPRDPNLDPLKYYDVRLLSVVALIAATALGLRIAWGHWTHNPHVNFDAAVPTSASFTVDLNTAGWAEISQLPDIGETMARRIVSRRNELGAFQNLEELDAIPGIGPKTLQSIRPFLAPLPIRATMNTSDTSQTKAN